MKRLAFLGVGSAVILSFGVMSAAPAFADNGPHVSTSGQMNVDRCAGCHRAHTATSAYLLNGSDETFLCKSCHGPSGTGASSDVIDGVGYAMGATGARSAVELGALRAGGFDNARMDGAHATRDASDPANVYTLIPTGSGSASTSKHQIGTLGTAWGSGANADGAGTTMTLECTSCHDPHGNGNYRILRPIPSTDTTGGVIAAWDFPEGLGITGVAFDHYTITEGRYKFYYSVTASSDLLAAKYKVTYPVTFDTGSGVPTNTLNLIVGGTIESISGSSAIVSGTNVQAITGWRTEPTGSVPPYTNVGGGAAFSGTASMGYADPSGIIKATTVTATTTTFKAWNGTGLVNAGGQTITLSGFDTTAYNGTFTVASAVSSNTSALYNTFTITTTGTAAANVTPAGKMGKITGIPDALSAAGATGATGPLNKVYVTTNYWAQDDHYYAGSTYSTSTTKPVLASGAQVAGKGTKTAFIANISQWCTTCHTRLLAGSGAWGKDSNDAMYSFEHRSNNGAEGSPNCIQCHVAHGSNASMSGTYSGAVAADANLKGPNGIPQVGATGQVGANSFLLRVDNRGTCNLCHNK